MSNAIGNAIGIPFSGTFGTTTYITPVSFKGGLINRDFEFVPPFTAPTTTASRFIDGTAAGSAGASKWIWYTQINSGTISFQYDTSVFRSGTASLKLSSTDPAARGKAIPGPVGGSTVTEQIIKKYGLLVLPNTTYRFSAWIKTNNAAASSAYIDKQEYTDTGVIIGGTSIQTTPALSGTNDWTFVSRTFTTAATAAYAGIRLNMGVVGIQDIWFDDVKLEQVISVTNSGATPALFYPKCTAVTTNNSIDQAQVTVTGAGALGDNGTAQKHAQSFTQTKKNFYGVHIQKGADVGTYTGNVTLSLRADNAGVPDGILSSITIPNATWTAMTINTGYEYSFPATVTPGSLYWIVFESSTQDASNYTTINENTGVNTRKLWNGSAWGSYSRGDFFETLYSRNTDSFTVSTDTQTVSVIAPTVDGWADGTVVSFTSPLTLAPGANNIYVSSDGPISADGTVDASLVGTLSGSYVI